MSTPISLAVHVRRPTGTARPSGPAWAAALLLLLAAGGPAARADEPKATTSPWRDEALVARRFAEACDTVEAVCEAKFRRRPAVRLASAAEIREAVRRQLAGKAEALGLDDEGLDRAADLSTRMIVGLFDPDRHAILVSSETAEGLGALFRLDPPLGEDDLRVVLAHEATHALDHERFESMRVPEAPTEEVLRADAAVVEGHAQHVARAAARRWGILPSFDRVTRLIAESPADLPEDLRRALAPIQLRLAFTYVQGLAFVDAVARARGRAGIEAALRDPPRDVRTIERPGEWLDGTTRPSGPDLDAVLAIVRPVLSDPAWRVGSQTMLRSMLRPMAPAPGAGAAEAAEFLEGRILSAGVEGEDARVVVTIALFEGEEQAAARMRDHLRTTRTKVESTPGVSAERLGERDGAGPEGRFPGGWILYRLAQGGVDATLEVHAAAVGPVTVVFALIGRTGITREVQDEVLARIGAFVRGAPTPSDPLPAVPFVRKNPRLTIRVRGPDGSPIPRAQARLYWDDHGIDLDVVEGEAETWREPRAMKAAVWGASDADGKPLDLAPQWDLAVAPEATELPVALAPGVALEGRVLDPAGAPAVDATVEALASDGGTFGGAAGPSHGSARTDSEGRFRIVGLSTARYALQVGRGEVRQSHEEVRARGGETGIEIRLDETRSVRIVVVDPDGRPVPFAETSVTENGRGYRRFSETTGLDGTATFPALDPSRSWTLEVTPPPTAGDLGILHDPEWDLTRSEVSLPRGYTIRGTVRDADGKPTAASVRWARGSGWTSVPTAADGSFALRHMPHGPVSIAAAPADWRPGTDRNVEWVEVTPEKPDVELVLKSPPVPGRPLIVVVRDGSGTPVPHARIALTAGTITSYHEARDGRASVPAPTERFSVEAFRAESADGASLDLGPARREGVDPGTEEVELRLPPGRSIRGTVRSGGTPVAGATLKASPVESAFLEHAESTSGADGTFELRGLGPGPYRIDTEAPAPFAAPATVERESGAEAVEIELAPGRYGTITVVDPSSQPVAAASVTVLRTRRAASSWSTRHLPAGLTDREGRLRIGPFATTDELTLEIEPPRGRQDLATLRVPDWKPGDGRLAFEAGRSIRGRVEDETGPVAASEVEWRTRGDRRPERVECGAGGRFVIRNAPVDGLELRAQRRGAHDDDAPWVAVEPGTQEVVLRLVPGPHRYRLRVAGATAPDVAYLVRHGSSDRVVVMFEEDSAPLELRPGTYALWVPEVGGGERCAFRAALRLGDQDEVTVDPEPTRTLRFRVKVPEGAVVHQSDVLGPLGIPFEAERRPDGTYEVRGLPAGRWTVKAKARSPDAWLYAAEEVETGEAVVEVEPKPK